MDVHPALVDPSVVWTRDKPPLCVLVFVCRQWAAEDHAGCLKVQRLRRPWTPDSHWPQGLHSLSSPTMSLNHLSSNPVFILRHFRCGSEKDSACFWVKCQLMGRGGNGGVVPGLPLSSTQHFHVLNLSRCRYSGSLAYLGPLPRLPLPLWSLLI